MRVFVCVCVWGGGRGVVKHMVFFFSKESSLGGGGGGGQHFILPISFYLSSVFVKMIFQRPGKLHV